MSDVLERLRDHAAIIMVEDGPIYCNLINEAIAEIDSLRSRLAAAEANNRRYRWLRDSPVEVVDAVLLDKEPSEWDDAIDAHLTAAREG
jgi:hypothetical protein